MSNVGSASCLNCRQPIGPEQHVCQVSVENTLAVVDMPRFNHADILTLNSYLSQLQSQLNDKYGINGPNLFDFIGKDATEMLIDGKKKRFVIQHANAEATFLPFHQNDTKHLISLLMVNLPRCVPSFERTPQYQAMDAMNLPGYLTSKFKIFKRKQRDTLVMAILSYKDIWVAKNGKIMDYLPDLKKEDLLMYFKEENDTYVPRKGVEFKVAKDTRLERLGSPHSLWTKQQGSLDMKKYANVLKKSVQDLEVLKRYRQGGIVQEIKEKVKCVVLNEICFLDASEANVGEMTGAVAKAFFFEMGVMHRESGKFEIGEDLSGEKEFCSYSAYVRTPSQGRTSGANAFNSLDSVVDFFYGTGQGPMTYAEKVKGMEGFWYEDVDKASKRYCVGMASGMAPEVGWLAKFNRRPKVTYFPQGKAYVNGEIETERYVLTAKDGETLTIDVGDDFYFTVQPDQPFLATTLNKDLSVRCVEIFDAWKAEGAHVIRRKNVTDGSGCYNKRVYDGLKVGKVLNSFDAHQGRPFVASKGNFRRDDLLCDEIGCDIFLTRGMVKSKNFLEDLKKHGFMHYVVGQRKDGADGIHIASQATQNMGLTEEDHLELVNDSIKEAKKIVTSTDPAEKLAWLNAADEENESSYDVEPFLQLAKDKKEILDEQWIKNEVKSLAVRETNKLLNAKLFVKRARNRYMFSDPFAIYNALKRGSYDILPEDCVLKPYEVVCPSKKEDGTFFMEEGEAVCVRFPISLPHEIPVVTSVAPEEYQPIIEEGLWQGCIFLDVQSWVVEQQQDADFDGDSDEVIFNKTIVGAVKRLKEGTWGGLPVLPFLNAHLVKDEAGNLLLDSAGNAIMGKGCPDFGKVKQELSWEKVGPFEVKGHTIQFKEADFKGPKAEENIRLYLKTRAQLVQESTLNSIEKAMIGIIANYRMILNDLLSWNPSPLSVEERTEIEKDSLNLTSAGEWEIDRFKHGGKYMEMEVMEKLFAIFEPITFMEEELLWSKEQKETYLVDTKKMYRHIFKETWTILQGKWVIKGYRVAKPQWLAAQKEESTGKYHKDSLYQQIYGSQRDTEYKQYPKSYVQKEIQQLCVEFKGDNNPVKNNIRNLIQTNMELDKPTRDFVKAQVEMLHNEFVLEEQARKAREDQFRSTGIQWLKENGKLGKKDPNMMTKAQKTAELKKQWPAEMEEISNSRDILKTIHRNNMYKLAKRIKHDPRVLVGALYLVIGDRGTKGTNHWVMDGKEYRFLGTNGYLYIPFQTFGEEMYALISGPVSKTPFIPFDLTFTLVDQLVIRCRVMNPAIAIKGGEVKKEQPMKVAVRKELHKGVVRTVMNFLYKNAEITSLDELTLDMVAFAGFASTEYQEGIHEIAVKKLVFDGTGNVADLYLG